MPRTAPNIDRTFQRYIADVCRTALLTAEEENHLARRYQQQGDVSAAHQLVAANLRFVLKVAHEYRGYGVSLPDLVQEGNMGLTMAVRRFDPDRGCRLISYAVWWVRACMGNCVMRSWSLVKVGTTQAQRKLFFKLRSETALANSETASNTEVSASTLAQRLRVQESDVVGMGLRLALRDLSLDRPTGGEDREAPLHSLCGHEESCESAVQREEIRHLVRMVTDRLMQVLNDKQRYIVRHRLLSNEPQSLRTVGSRLNISGERARQIEGDVLRRLRACLESTGLDSAA
jgi:RNA polymerase sigma-32 factor